MFFLLRLLRTLSPRIGRRRRSRFPIVVRPIVVKAPKKRPVAEKVSTIGGRVVPDTEAYSELLDLYDEYVSLLERLERTKEENEHAYANDPAVRERWAASRRRVEGSIASVAGKLDALEMRNPGIASSELVGRRTGLAERERAL